MPMTMPSLRPDPWRLVWRIVTGNVPLAVCLFVLALYLLLLAWIPQFSPGSVATDRWLAQSRFGPWTGTMYRLGIFSLARSPFLTILLSLLLFFLLIRGIDLAVAFWESVRSGSEPGHFWQIGAFFLLADLGVLIFLLGLLIGQRWGWREEGLIALDNGRVPGRDEVPGVFATHSGIRLTVRATDAFGSPANLQRSVRQAAQPELILYLSPAASETSFAIPEHNLVIWLGVQGVFSARSPVQIEVFRAPSGERVQGTRMDQDSLRLAVDEVHLEIVREPQPLLSAIYDPGLWPKRVGLILGTVSLAGALWPWRRKERVVGVFLSILTLAVGGVSAWSLETSGTFRGSFPFQMEITALWLVSLAIWLSRHKENGGWHF